MKASRLSERTRDLANLAAQQHEALRLLAPKGPEGMKMQVDAIHAAEAFKEKYELVEGAAASINQAVKNGAHK